MIRFLETYFNRIYLVSCFAVFVVIILRAFFIPFSHDEVATFFYYIQSDNYLPYLSHVYTNNHILNSALANICYHLAGSHRFVLRIPNMLAFLLLCYGTFRYFRHLNSVYAKLLLLTFFILTFNFLDFFELCRGYGLSISFMILGLSYLQDYFADRKTKSFLMFSACWQLALAANLILVVVLTVVLGYILLFQLKNKLLGAKTLVIQLVNLALMLFWIRLSFFYRSQGVLDAGPGEDYWQVTFKSLIIWLFGADNLWLQISVVAGFCLLVGFSLVWLFRSMSLNTLFNGRVFYTLILVTLVLVFYLQKKILHVNFPEDRTGLFFYLFYVLSLAFLVNSSSTSFSSAIVVTLFVASTVRFCFVVNVSAFNSLFYYTMPKSFYDKLKAEYDKTGKIFTLGGHRVRELNYAFMNYRGGGILNHMDDAEQMYMNCDYYYAMKREAPYYKFFYDEIAYDKVWDQVLLKRKEKIVRKQVAEASPGHYSGTGEFFEFIRITDPSFALKNSLEAELEISFKQMPKPFNGFVVFSIDNSRNETVYYKRIPLNMLADDLSGETKYMKLTTGQMPADFKSAVVYVWNIDKKNVDFTLKVLRIHELYGKGINFKIPDSFYPLVEKITKRSLL